MESCARSTKERPAEPAVVVDTREDAGPSLLVHWCLAHSASLTAGLPRAPPTTSVYRGYGFVSVLADTVQHLMCDPRGLQRNSD